MLETAFGLKFGIEYRDIMNESEQWENAQKLASEMNCVLIVGLSDDITHLAGAISEELCESYDGFDYSKVSQSQYEDMGCNISYYETIKQMGLKVYWYGRCDSKTVEARKNLVWSFDVNVPHEQFDIFEDGDLMQKGLIISLETI